MAEMRRPYRPFDDVVVGDILDLGGRPRRVLSVSRDRQDRVRFIGVNRLKCGYARGVNGETLSYCSGPVPLHHSDLTHKGTYRFRGYLKRAPTDSEPQTDER